MTDTTTRTSTGIERGWVIGAAVAALVFGVVGLLATDAALLGIAMIFGVALLIVGLSRLIIAFAGGAPTRERWFSGILGGIVLIAAVLCLSNPWDSLVALGLVIGLGWVADGVASIASATGGFRVAPRWLPVVAGIVSIVGGVIVMIFPVTGLATFVLVASILLIVIGVSMLFLLPKRR